MIIIIVVVVVVVVVVVITHPKRRRRARSPRSSRSRGRRRRRRALEMALNARVARRVHGRRRRGDGRPTDRASDRVAAHHVRPTETRAIMSDRPRLGPSCPTDRVSAHHVRPTNGNDRPRHQSTPWIGTRAAFPLVRARRTNECSRAIKAEGM